MRLEAVAAWCHGELSGMKDVEVTGFTTDSRAVQAGNVYIPLKGEHFDGHDFIPDAFARGACACLASRDVDIDQPVIRVADTLQALQMLAAHVREQSKATVVAVTGSAGKTSTRDMIAAVTRMKYKTLQTQGNYNNQIGLPLSLLSWRDEEVMVLEMGMNHRGEIAVLSKIAKPDIAVITNVGTAHIGFLGSRENILKAKMEIVEGMSAKGILIVNQDNDLLAPYATPYSYSLNEVENIELLKEKSRFVYHGVDFEIPQPGKYAISNALAAIKVGEVLKVPYQDMREALKNVQVTAKRLDILHLPDDITVLDGSYNANPDSMTASLTVLKNLGKRRIAVLGDMRELGEYSAKMHGEIGPAVDEAGVDILICVGEESREIAQHCHAPNIFTAADNIEAWQYLEKCLQSHDAVLVKGSNSMRLSEIVLKIKEKYAHE